MIQRVFIDAAPLISLVNPRDQFHLQITTAMQNLEVLELITTDAVLTEVLNYYAERGEYFRTQAVNAVERLMLRPEVTIVYHSQYLFYLALERFKARRDKGYSLTDCMSMVVMETHQIQTVLTTDSHFRQAGYLVIP
jgi:uncharacterized protein